ncbi:Methyltransferase domain-containing protein [Mariprofundus aestuarium]|uniref:Methyltransferase domain-containing protein n=1 Tax=Mariprofundus aestuarium TaxID=1921086 RepID=A0A2K8KXH4_MARES|nr:class I SAM-dependent methyltransferase [Mariprofundus aestuarium]ATX79660.1 Methyltransferase domain-containing protein [Mariprofundus aestuarium]
MNSINQHRFTPSELLAIQTQEDFSDFLIHKALEQYEAECKAAGASLGRVLAICATEREASNFGRYAFDSITLTGLHDQDASLSKFIDADPRMRYERQNGEALSYENQSYDLVFCKSGLHHFARPVLGLYEMLRVCKRCVAFIEPYETQVSRLFDGMGLRSIYERDESMNIDSRDNYVFRWDRRMLEQVLNSYYLESGYSLKMGIGWMSNRFNAHSKSMIRTAAALSGYLFSWIPGCGGNQVICMITPGSSLPPDAMAIPDSLHVLAEASTNCDGSKG